MEQISNSRDDMMSEGVTSGGGKEKIDVGHYVPALATRQPGWILSGKGQGQGESEVGRMGLWESLQIG